MTVACLRATSPARFFLFKQCWPDAFGTLIAQFLVHSWTNRSGDGTTERHMAHSISVFGLGYVGSITAACLAQEGNRVIGVDINPAKVAMLDSGRAPILEPEVDKLVEQGRLSCRLHATTDPISAVCESEISFICVGTPSLRNGKLDLGSVKRVCHEVGKALRRKKAFHLVVLRSTILPGTTESLVIPTLEFASGKHAGEHFAVCVNPEFMREGCAVTDFRRPPLTILGAADLSHLTLLRELYDNVSGKTWETSLSVAEMVKYVCNAFHALKVGFANEIGTICRQLDVDTQAVMEIFASDMNLNISSAYLKPGFAFGGSCLPKDLRALIYRAKEDDLRLPLVESILPSNQEHIERAADAVLRTGKKGVGILGLGFKVGTDDLRESPLVYLIKRLLGEGCHIQVWDPYVSHGHLIGSNRQFIEEVIPHIGSLLCSSLEAVVETAEVVLIGTKVVEKQVLATLLRPEQQVIDLVNLEKHDRIAGPAVYDGICW